MITIETIKNGWITIDNIGTKESFHDLQSLFDHLLLVLDGRAEGFGGSLYGKVTVKLKES